MAVEKMYFINVAGPLKEIDAFVINNIIPFEIQLVRAFSILDSVKGLMPFDVYNPYDILLKKVSVLCKDLNINTTFIDEEVHDALDFETVEADLDEHIGVMDTLIQRKQDIEAQIDHKEQIKKQIIPIQGLDVEVDKLFDLDFMKFRFGKMPKESFQRIEQYNENLELIVIEVFREEDDVFLMYFMPNMVRGEIDSLFASLYFTRIRISEEVKGYPKEALYAIEKELGSLREELEQINDKINNFSVIHQERISKLYGIIHKLNHIFTVRTYAVHSLETFYITGWIPHSQLNDFVNKMKVSDAYSFLVEEDETIKRLTPPTKLKNNSFFKPFEALVAMYGIPSYHELDPTAFVGITYLLMFGVMFGDVGQGFVIALLGYLLFKKSGSALGHIAIYLGASSMVSGLFYGSIFGNEELLRHVLPFIPMINPMEHKTSFLAIAIAFGVILIIIAMILNMINSIKNKKIGRFLFDRNGLVGIVVYFSILYVVLAKVFVLETTLLPAILLIIISFGIILMSHPLQKFLESRKEFLPEDKTGFFIESAFELIETILAILSNTISFMRVGAFALNHVGLIIAFHMLSDMVAESSGGVGSLLVMIFGNVLIIALEGLIVGIQGLRLEYYELFSRFFEGDGSEFKPFLAIKKVKA
ncbi:MAG: V-type ATP synthase subunit I [Firmicutes bacterium HGW-Firmicutes-7]|nr:MAG: V-type ATP synthase subunit I [Firmicutes bacterium HGW-Firmicutes-7]